MRSSNVVASIAILALLSVPSAALKSADRFLQAHERQQDLPASATELESTSECNSTSCYKYYNSKTAPYLIKQWPDIPWTTGEFYSGSVPIDDSDPSRTLFFIFKPATDAPTEEITIWLNGGPGCSSLVGFFSENGPILMQPGTNAPVKNPFAWSRMTNVLWVDNPVGTGFSQGNITTRNETDIATEFVNFYKNWQKIFGTEKSKIYVTGESYAGKYVPNIGYQMLQEQSTCSLDLSGILIYDPCIGDCGYVQMETPTYRFATANNGILNFNQTFLEEMKQLSIDCGFENYTDTYLTFPPPKHQPPSPYLLVQPETATLKDKCVISEVFKEAWASINPCYNLYYIADFCPKPVGWSGQVVEEYLSRKDVKAAIHAPENVTWEACVTNYADVFVKGEDNSLLSIEHVLPTVIEATNRTLIGHGDWDAIIFTNGTLMTIQNMTWNGQLGFQTAPHKQIEVPLPWPQLDAGPQGIMGVQHYERGLMWVETYQSGHQQPEYQPRVSWRHLEWLLGKIETL